MKVLPVFVLLCASAAWAQNKSSKEYYRSYYTACWQTDDTGDGYLVTWANRTFQWVRPNNTGSRAMDTLSGTWHIRSVYSIPFKDDVIVFVFSDHHRERYQIGTTSTPAVIYLRGDSRFHKVDCR